MSGVFRRKDRFNSRVIRINGVFVRLRHFLDFRAVLAAQKPVFDAPLFHRIPVHALLKVERSSAGLP